MKNPNFTPFPILTSERLILRKLTTEDAPDIFIQRSHPLICKYIKRAPAADLREAEEWIAKMLDQEARNETINWAIVPKGETQLIGLICLWKIEKEASQAEVGYGLHPDYFNKGLMSEALKSVITYGFKDMDLHRIDAYTHKDNQASLKLLAKNGFVRNSAFEEIYEDKEELEYNTIHTLNRY